MTRRGYAPAPWNAYAVRKLRASRSSSQLQPSGNWPLTIQGDLTLPSPGSEPWTLALKVEGDLLKTLNLHADSRGYLDGQLNGELQALAENLPAKLRITSAGICKYDVKAAATSALKEATQACEVTVDKKILALAINGSAPTAMAIRPRPTIVRVRNSLDMLLTVRRNGGPSCGRRRAPAPMPGHRNRARAYR